MKFMKLSFSQKALSALYTCLLIGVFGTSVHSLTAQQGLVAEYYDGSNFERFVFKEYVGNIEAFWDENPPVKGIDPHNCSIRYTGKLKPAKTGKYSFSALVDDGIRVWIDGVLIIDQWTLNDVGNFKGTKEMVANRTYDIKVEYFNALREAEIKLMWAVEKPKEQQSWKEYFLGVDHNYQVIPSSSFVSSEKPVAVVKVSEKPAPKVVKKVEKKTDPKTPKVNPPTSVPQENTKEVMTVAKAEKFIPKNVQFVISKPEVIESSYAELNTFAAFMLENPVVAVTVEGHTDVEGDKDKNQALSEARAEKVANYLIEKGIDKRRIKTIGYGSSKPLKIPEKGSFYPPNRRVVFVLSGLEN